MNLNNVVNLGENTLENVVGLTTSEVKQRIKEGKVNHIPKTPSRTIPQIIRANLFTTFNPINFILPALFFLQASLKNTFLLGLI